MKRVWIIVGVLALVAGAFIAGQFLARPFLFGPADGTTFRPQGEPGMVEFAGNGDTFSGAVTAIADTSITVSNDTEEFVFEISADTRVVDLGEVDGLQLADTIQVAYQAVDGVLIALTISATN